MAEPEGGARTPASDVRLLDAMPRPLLIVFLGLGLVAVAVVVTLLVRPPRFDTVPLEARRPPPSAPHTHDPAGIDPVVLPRDEVPFTPPCEAVEGVRVRAGAFGVRRLEDALEHICRLAGPSASPGLRRAVEGLRGTTVRFALFERTGAESAADLSQRVLWLNVKLSERKLILTAVVPVILHDAYHLARPTDPVTAAEELAARAVEADACRQLLRVEEWPRWCDDAAALTKLPRARALELLGRAGYVS